jgi:predicted metal-binding membrane protein
VLRAHQVDESVAPDSQWALGTRDGRLALGGIFALAAAAWAYTVRTAGTDHAMAPAWGAAWGGAELAGLFVMWAVMMTAMMVPPATPVFLLFLGVMRRRHGATPLSLTAAFVAGYLAVWAGFSVLAALTQYALHAGALLSPGAMRVTAPIAGGLLIAAGVWQWTPMKRVCLAHCRSPLHFLTTAWREGVGGALSMGVRHGLWCLGCCWLLMALLFVAGVMNVLWIAALSMLVLLEKVAPQGMRLGRVWGVLLVAAGVWLLRG